MASFEKRGNSIRAIVKFPDGKRSATFDTMTEARAWATNVERQKQLGTVSNAKVRTVEDLILDYLPRAEMTDSGKWNKLRLMSFCTYPLAKVNLHEVTPHHINEWITARLKQVVPGTVNREMNLWRSVFTHGVQVRKWLQASPCKEAMKPPAGVRRNRPLLTPKEIEAISIATGYNEDPELVTKSARVGACFFLAMETALRSGEILRIRPKDYDRHARTLYVHALERGGRKGSKSGTIQASRWVPLTNRAIELLDQLLESMPKDQQSQENFSMPPYIVGMTDSQRDALWRKARDRSGVEDLHFHDLKHEAATRLARFIDVIALSHAIGTKDLKLLRDTYYNNDASRIAHSLPNSLAEHQPRDPSGTQRLDTGGIDSGYSRSGTPRGQRPGLPA